MLTADLLRAIFQAIVTSHVADVAFYPVWSNALDKSEQHVWPRVYWKQPTVGMDVDTSIPQIRNTYQVSFSVLGQVASDRAAGEVVAKHSEMAALASMFIARFADLYIFDTTSYQGVEIDVTMTGAPTLQPVWDAENMATGVIVTFTLSDNRNTPCFDDYFA